MTDETKKDDQASEFEKRAASLTAEQRAEARSVLDKLIDGEQKQSGSLTPDDLATVTRGTDNAAKEIIRRKFGYTPQF